MVNCYHFDYCTCGINNFTRNPLKFRSGPNHLSCSSPADCAAVLMCLHTFSKKASSSSHPRVLIGNEASNVAFSSVCVVLKRTVMLLPLVLCRDAPSNFTNASQLSTVRSGLLLLFLLLDASLLHLHLASLLWSFESGSPATAAALLLAPAPFHGILQ